MVVREDGSRQMTMQPIYLPDGKTPFILSQDDVCYYEYMKGQGFPDRFVIGADGKVTNEYTLDDGTVIRGSFDVMPILEDFIEAHPDFSYRGAKGTLAVTGYNGIWGYRTSDFWYNWSCPYFDATKTEERSKKFFNNENIEADKKAAAKAAGREYISAEEKIRREEGEEAYKEELKKQADAAAKEAARVKALSPEKRKAEQEAEAKLLREFNELRRAAGRGEIKG
jgi:hypothetical protein